MHRAGLSAAAETLVLPVRDDGEINVLIYVLHVIKHYYLLAALLWHYVY